MILADEGLNGHIVRGLRNAGFSVEWILETAGGITDKEVIIYAQKNSKILITEDKDFGEWVFAHKVRNITVIFLRYEKEDVQQILFFLMGLLKELSEQKANTSVNEFIAINKNKVRRRRI